MPYSRNSELPKAVRDALPAAAQSRFREVVNSALERGLSEEKAFASAWHVVNAGWKKGKDGKWVRKMEPRTLYVCRYVQNAAAIRAWAKEQGFKTTLPAEEMHVTIAYSKSPLDWMKVPEPPYYDEDEDGNITVRSSPIRAVQELGDKGAVVLLFKSSMLQYRHSEIREAGASWDWDSYQPHLTITYDKGDLDLSKVTPYTGEIVLGPEHFKEIEEDWAANMTEKIDNKVNIVKVDDDQRMVYGWASVITEKGEPVVDTQDDVIEAHELEKAVTEFMADARIAKAMHEGDKCGEVLHSFPITDQLAKGLGIACERQGWIVGVKVHSDDIWKQVKDGTLRAFSIGGVGARVPIEETT